MFEENSIEIILLDKRVNFKMPNKGYTGNGAQFPTAWFTYGLNIGNQLTFGFSNFWYHPQHGLFADAPNGSIEDDRISVTWQEIEHYKQQPAV